MPTNQQAEKWKELYEDWHHANELARDAFKKVTEGFVAAGAGKGTGPTMAEIDAAEELQAVADQKRADMDGFLKDVFG